jgi:hypothetical protein
MDIQGTAIVPERFVEAVRAGCATIEGGHGMFTTGVLDPDNNLYYISAGHVRMSIATFLNSIKGVYNIDLSRETPEEAMTRLNLRFVNEVQ